MSLRRSARLSTTDLPIAPKRKASGAVTNGVVNGKPKSKPANSESEPKKRKGKASASVLPEDTAVGNRDTQQEAEFAIPTTPVSKKRKAQAADSVFSNAPPLTPTPSAIHLMRSSSPAAPPSNIQEKYKSRPAEPHATNAPLSTPGGSKVLAYTSSPVKQPADSEPEPSPAKKARKAKDLPPDVGRLPHPTSTTDTLLSDACAHLISVDPNFKHVISQHHCKMFSPEGLAEPIDPFTALASGIIGQQVSGAAAASIKRKFVDLFPTTAPEFPAPAVVADTSIERLRTAGLSQRKAEYIQGLAGKFASGELSARILVSCSDEELIERLVAVRGLGRWSVEMFACFGLKRMDVFSTGDLGVQKGMAVYAGRDVSKLKNKGGKWKYMTEKEMLDIAAKFSPYRSLFMWYMWRYCDVDISVMPGD